MNENTSDNEAWEEIEKFVLGQLPDESKAAFQEKLNNDPALQKATNEAKLLLLGIEESALQQKIDGFHDRLQQSAPAGTATVVKMKQWLRWGIAASILIIAGIVAYLFIGNKNTDEKLFAMYFKPDPGLVTAMGTSTDYSFDRAMIDYKTRHYKEAIAAWQELLSENKSNDTLHYFIGCAYLADEQATASIPLFEKVVSGNNIFKKDAYWYLALAYLQQGNRDKALFYAEKSEHSKTDELIQKLKH